MDSNCKLITFRFYVQYGFSNHSFYEKMGNKHLQLWWSEVYLFNKEINDCVEGPCFILHVSTVTSSFRLQLYLGLSMFSLGYFCCWYFLFPPQKNKLLKWRPRIPSQVLGKCRQEKMCRSARLSRPHCAAFPAAPHSVFGNICSCLSVAIPGSHDTIRLQFSSHFATRIGRWKNGVHSHNLECW